MTDIVDASTVTVAAPLAPPPRLLTGPGPSNVHPAVLDAMQRPMLGHLDPAFHAILDELTALLRAVWRRPGGMSIAVSASGTTGIETCITNLVAPGDTVVCGVAGYFGERIAQMVARRGAQPVEVRAEWGESIPNERLLDALRRHPDARLVAVVHAETSTGVAHPLRELADALAGTDTLLFADCVTSFGGMELEPERWGVDACAACTQKCLGAPPGISPVSLSERALERARELGAPVPVTMDLEWLGRYWIERPATYHHTAPILQLYALHEALRLALEEGVEARWARHADAGAYLQEELAARGFDLLADPEFQLAQLTAVRVPEGVDGKAVQARLLDEHGIEVGGGLGPTAPPIWRIGLMGVNATRDAADRVLAALDDVLPERRAAG